MLLICIRDNCVRTHGGDGRLQARERGLRREQSHGYHDLGASSLGEGNGTPLQYSCLENPMTEEPGRLQSMGS